ncbi:protein C2-DOMAIN ABA-RELATED 3-like [Neltuma alba]|uniref:protein C2-DOMAIN ABA-RELATED 3-like n=1 Tax=Neltuma alba TaxID=207710 RepID=UPI0010A3665F|nr:protein C2-DOMAIN ABA-RELATED 3-like [Prosopis alba]XP_028794311.1 protein C2-DOMAIN ABA-RELATED 3-like [Prosopis alba]
MGSLTGYLKVHVKRGHDLATRSGRSSNAYVVVKMGHQKWKTGVVKKNVNPEWNEELIFDLRTPDPPLQLFVYNKGKFSSEDKMGQAEFDINPFHDAVMGRLERLKDGDIITTIEPNRGNCLAEESQIVWKDGKVVQNMFIRLNNVERGEVELQLSMVYWWGLLKIHVQKGVNLAIRDVIRRSSDPYVVFKMDRQQVKTRVVKQNVNPEWNEELTLYIPDPPLPVELFVYDRDTFSSDDKMGEAEFDINPIVEAVKMGVEGLADGTTIRTIPPNRQNRLVERSQIVWKDGQVVQNMVLRLKDVVSGEVELQLRWIKLPTARGL